LIINLGKAPLCHETDFFPVVLLLCSLHFAGIWPRVQVQAQSRDRCWYGTNPKETVDSTSHFFSVVRKAHSKKQHERLKSTCLLEEAVLSLGGSGLESVGGGLRDLFGSQITAGRRMAKERRIPAKARYFKHPRGSL